MQITEFFEGNYRLRRLRGKSPHTVRLYRSSLRLLNKVFGRAAELSDFNDDTISAVMQHVIDRGGSPATANKERSQLLAIWRYACQLGLIEKWPVTAEKEPERSPKAWLAEDVAKLLTTIQDLEGTIGNAPASTWWLAIVFDLPSRRFDALTIEAFSHCIRCPLVAGLGISLRRKHEDQNDRNDSHRLHLTGLSKKQPVVG